MLMNVFITTFGISGGRNHGVMDFGAIPLKNAPASALSAITTTPLTTTTTMAAHVIAKAVSGLSRNATGNL